MTEPIDPPCKVCHEGCLELQQEPRFGGEVRILGKALKAVGYLGLLAWLATAGLVWHHRAKLGDEFTALLLITSFYSGLAVVLVFTALGAFLASAQTTTLACDRCGAALPAWSRLGAPGRFS